MPHLRVWFLNGDQNIKQRQIRLYRLMDDKNTSRLYLDVKVPKGKPITEIVVNLWNGGGQKPLLMDNLTVETFDSAN